ncbi:MAG: rhodanese-like domain-containing protein [Gemmatimonadales bacterium]|nr:rhodanese-like domain-containing protein [Gemmatimonadales bacterium]
MRRTMRAAMAALVVAMAACGGRAPAEGAGWSRVSAEAFAAELAQGRPAGARPLTIVDVREPELFAKGHIPGAINIPWPGVKESAATQLAKEHAIVMVCHGGPMGDDVAQRLVAAGFPDVRNVAGGMNAWAGPTVPGGS